MEEKIKDVLEAYSFEVRRVSRGRGAFICDTDQGMKLVKAYHRSPQRLEFEQLVKGMIRDRGYYYIDQFVPNKEGTYLNANQQDGLKYVVRDWFEGKECDVKNPADLLAAVRQLASLHLLLQRVTIPEERLEMFDFDDTQLTFKKRYKELRAISSYIRRKKQWNDFEKLFMRQYADFMTDARRAMAVLNMFDYDGMRRQITTDRILCHGDFNYHQVLLSRQYTAVINFDRMKVDSQIIDLYQFLRKVMEKNNWDQPLGFLILDAYVSVKPLTPEELKYLYSLLIFPEKYWKIANRYYNARKSWFSDVNYEKMCRLMKLQPQRQQFIQGFGYCSAITARP